MSEALSIKKIDTVEQAIELFFSIANGAEPDFDRLEFGDAFNVEFRLPTYHTEVPRQFIQAYYATYRRIYQFLALIENGRADMKTLTKEQQEKYPFTVKVTEGSSQLEDNAAEILGGALVEAFKKMSGRQAVIVILGTVLIGFTAWGTHAYIGTQKEIRLAEIQAKERVDLVASINAADARDQETMKSIIETMVSEGGVAGHSAVSAVENIQDQRLRAMAETDVTEVEGMQVTGDQARELRSGTRRKSVEVTTTMEMRVVDVNTADPAETVVILEDIETGEQTKLRYVDRVMGDHFNPIVIDALARRSTAMFALKGKMVDEQITYTEISGVQSIEPDPAEGAETP